MTQLPSAALILLNYNGLELLKRYLASFVEASKKSTAKCRVIVLDNCSQDASVNFVREQFPEVTVFLASKNDVLCSFNELVPHLSEDVVILLNNDIQADPGFVDPLLKLFQDKPDIFFATTYGNRSFPSLHWGILSANISPDAGFNTQAGYAFSAGAPAFDRKKFLELGGYDELYLPGYYEDVDLCFRGWKKGWKGYYCPESRLDHEGSASFQTVYGSYKIQKLTFRNGILFMIKNITSFRLLFWFSILLVLRLLTSWLFRKWYIYEGFFEALPRIPQALKARDQLKGSFKITDHELLKQFE